MVVTYSKKSNAVRGAKRAGLPAAAVKQNTEGQWYVDVEVKKSAPKAPVKAKKPAVKAKAAKKAAPKPVAKVKATVAPTHSIHANANTRPMPAGVVRSKHDYPGEGTKGRMLLDLLMSPRGATMEALMAATRWKAPTVRTEIQRVTAHYGFAFESRRFEDAPTRWFAWRRAA